MCAKASLCPPAILWHVWGGGGTRGYTQKASLSNRIHADTRGYTVPARSAKFDLQSEKVIQSPIFRGGASFPLVARRVDQYCQDPAAIFEAFRRFKYPKHVLANRISLLGQGAQPPLYKILSSPESSGSLSSQSTGCRMSECTISSAGHCDKWSLNSWAACTQGSEAFMLLSVHVHCQHLALLAKPAGYL